MLRKKSCPEDNVRYLLDEHLEMVGEVLAKTGQTAEEFLEGKIEAAKAGAKEIDRLEHQADEILRSIFSCLQNGAFMPIMRKDVFQLVSAVDGVANAAESIADFMLSQRPDIPDEFLSPFSDVISANLEMYPQLREAVGFLKLGNFSWNEKNDSLFKEIARSISIAESDIDDLEWKLTREIFSSSLPLANKMHIHALLKQITKVSDLIENVADRIQIMITREAI